jgi:hypothetical protein
MRYDRLFEAYQELVRWVDLDTIKNSKVVTVDISGPFRSLVVYPSGETMRRTTKKFDSKLVEEGFCGLEHFKRDKGGKRGRERYLEIFGNVLFSHREKFVHVKTYSNSARHFFRRDFDSFIEPGTILILDKNYLPWVTVEVLKRRYQYVETVQELKYFKLLNTEGGPIIVIAEDVIQSNCEDDSACSYKCKSPIPLLYKGFLISDNLANFCRRLITDHNNIKSHSLLSLKPLAKSLTRMR